MLDKTLPLRVSGAQLPVTHDVNENVAKISEAIRFAAESGADILLTPEGSLSGYWPDFDSDEVCRALEHVVAIAARADIALGLGTCFQEANGRRYNQLRFYDSAGGFIGAHSKILLCKHVRLTEDRSEADIYASAPLNSFQWQGMSIGGLICNDAWANPECTPQDDPHLIHRLAKLGAKVVFIAINAGLGEGDGLALNRAYHDSNLRLRARASGVWLVTADAADPNGMVASQAPTGVVSPSGEWLVQTDPIGSRRFTFDIELGL